jgi:hypothetical protein
LEASSLQVVVEEMERELLPVIMVVQVAVVVLELVLHPLVKVLLAWVEMVELVQHQMQAVVEVVTVLLVVMGLEQLVVMVVLDMM